MRLSLLLAGALGGAAVVTPAAHAAPPPTQVQRAGGFVIRWPATAALSTVEPATRVRVVLVPSRRARAARRVAVVSLVYVTRSGAPIKVVTRRRMRAGTFTARVPALEYAHYRVTVTIGRARVHRDFDVAQPDPCPAGPTVSGTLSANPSEARAGQSVSLELTNTGAACLEVGYFVSWQVNRDGTWVEIPPTRPTILVALSVPPGQTFQHGFVVPEDAAPGQYRVVQQIRGGGSPVGSHVDVSADVTVVPEARSS